MKRVTIVYFSGYGHTRKLAQSVLEGVNRVADISGQMIEISPQGTLSETDWNLLSDSHGIIFGAPTYMGSCAGAFKMWQDSTSKVFARDGWKDKIAAGFTMSGTLSGDKLNSLFQLAVLAAQHGMIWVGQAQKTVGKTDADLNRLGSYLGLMAQSDNGPAEDTVLASDKETAVLFGIRVAETVNRFN